MSLSQIIHPAYPLTRFMPQDWEKDPALTPWLAGVDADFESASPQHPARRWEYSMAVLAGQLWKASGHQGDGHSAGRAALDIGGAGSPLCTILAKRGWGCVLLDPAAGTASIEEYAKAVAPFADACFSVSVLEHVRGEVAFLAACVKALAPGGLLFLTVDAWAPPVGVTTDEGHYHWMRERLYTPVMLEGLICEIRTLGLRSFGEVDLTWHGPTVFNYGFCSLAFVKEI